LDGVFLLLSPENMLCTQYIVFDRGSAHGDSEEGYHRTIPQMRIQSKHSNSSQVWSSKHWGIGFRELYTEQSLLLTSMVLKHLRIPGQAHTLIRIALAWSQLASGVGFPIIEFPDQELPTMEDPFLQGIRSGLSHLNTTSIRLHDNLIRPLSRQGDFYIMERLQALGTFSTPESLRVNYCRLYLGAYLASAIISPDGRKIHWGSFKGPLAQGPNTPSVKLPRQARPDKENWAQWCRALHFSSRLPDAPSSTC
jgi:hypothetical protein